MIKESYKAFAVANYILDKLGKHKIKDVTNLKLQKLLYFAYGINLVLYDDILFDSNIHAYRLGPVIPDVYREFKDHGKNIITTRAHFLKDDDSGEVELASYSDFTTNDKKSIDIACSAKGHTKAWDLVDITHRKHSAWSKVYKEEKRHIDIPNSYIKKEFEQYIDTLAKYLLG